MAYSELIKNFEKIRTYLREFYIYGYKSRNDYCEKSSRTYDDEKRRIESYMQGYMSFNSNGVIKKPSIIINSRIVKTNPFYKAFKSKSFTDGDITLHFVIFDILIDETVQLTLKDIISNIDEYLESKMTFDESTIRKKLKEYEKEGLIVKEKIGRLVYYKRAKKIDLSPFEDAINYYSEIMPCGVIGSFIKDHLESNSPFNFKHHYIASAIDSEVLTELFIAISNKESITVTNNGRHYNEPRIIKIVPLKIYISSQNGRQYLISYNQELNRINTYRIDYLKNIKHNMVYQSYDEIKNKFLSLEKYMWGVNCRLKYDNLQTVSFDIVVRDNEEYIIQRLIRERRNGSVSKIDDNHYHFETTVFDGLELIPWIRTYISRITNINFSNKELEKIFFDDLNKMYKLYEVGDINDI